MSARLHPVCETPGVNDVLLRTCAPAALPQPELLVGQLLGRCERRALLRHFQLADFATEAEFLRHYAARAAEAAVAATGGSDAATCTAAQRWRCVKSTPASPTDAWRMRSACWLCL